MASKKIILKNLRLWYHSSKKTSYIPEKENDDKYKFREMRWTKGVVIDAIVNTDTRLITRSSDKTFSDYSLTNCNNNEWGKRKIIHTIKINVDKNTASLYDDAITFSIVQVKKSIFDDATYPIGSKISDKNFWGLNQLIDSPDLNMFNTSFELNDLFYDLPFGEDLVIIQNIAFKSNHKLAGSKKYAEAINPYINYEICIIYSDGYI